MRHRIDKGSPITTVRPHKGLLVASTIWIICITAALIGAMLRSTDVAVLWPYALGAITPAVLGLALWPFIRKEWAQILVILAWLALAIVACLSIAFYPMAFLFMCAPAAAAMFEKEKVIEAMFLSAVFAALIYYAGSKDFMGAKTIANDLQSDWGGKAAIASTIAFLIAAMYGTADSAKTAKSRHSAKTGADVLEAIPSGIMRLNGDNHVRFANGSTRDMFDMPADNDIVPVTMFFHQEEDKRALTDMLSSVRSRKGSDTAHFKTRNRSGDDLHVDITATAIDDDYLLLHLQDVTHQNVQVQSLNDERTNAVKQTEDKTLFFAGVSHELRTPLNAIIGFSDMMRSRLFGPLPGKYAEYADMIHDSGQHMLDLIGDVLDMTKVEVGKYDLTYNVFEASDVIRSSIKMTRPMADASEVVIEADIADEPFELLIEADRKALRQMLLNLLSNAIKFSPKGGKIIVSAKVVADILNITVSDEGVGMTAEELKQIGKPFAQTSSGKNSEHRGSGLGLALVKSLVELHGGRLAMASQPDNGTTADIYLPLKRGDEA